MKQQKAKPEAISNITGHMRFRFDSIANFSSSLMEHDFPRNRFAVRRRSPARAPEGRQGPDLQLRRRPRRGHEARTFGRRSRRRQHAGQSRPPQPCRRFGRAVQKRRTFRQLRRKDSHQAR